MWSVAKSCPILCDPMDCSLPGSPVHGVFQARILEWVVISSSRGSSQPRDQTCICCIGRWIPYHWGTWESPALENIEAPVACPISPLPDFLISLNMNILRPHELYSPWNSPGQNTGMGSCSLLQGIFLSHGWTKVFQITGGFFTIWSTREEHIYMSIYIYIYLYKDRIIFSLIR